MIRKVLILVAAMAAGCANAAVFQKVTEEVQVGKADIAECSVEADQSLSVVFSEQGQQKLAKVLNEDDTKMNFIVDGVLLMTLQVPRAMKSFDKFKVTVDKSGKLAREWGCTGAVPAAPSLHVE